MTHEFPTLTLDEHSAEVKRDLWLLRNAMPERPDRDDDQYVSPARFYLDNLRCAVREMQAGSAAALIEVPEPLVKRLQIYIRQRGPDWTELAIDEPELRRYRQVAIVTSLLEDLLQDLENEGRPQPTPDLHLTRVRRSS